MKKANNEVKTDLDPFILMLTGSVTDFEDGYRKLFPKIYAYSRKFISNPEEAQDLVQDVFLNLFNKRKDLQLTEGTVSGYLYRSAHNKCLNFIRNQQKHHIHKQIIFQELMHYNQEYTSIFTKDIEAVLYKRIELLPNQQKQIFKLSRFHHLSNSVIADTLDLSIRTVENLIYRTLRQLKTDLKDYLD